MTKVKFELECLKKLLKRESIARFVDSLPDKATADLNYIYIVPNANGRGKKAYVLRPDRTGFDAIDLSSQNVNVVGEGYITVEKQVTEDGVDTFTVKTNETLSSLLTQLGSKDRERDAKIEDVRHRVEVLENRPEPEREDATARVESNSTGVEVSSHTDGSTTVYNVNIDNALGNYYTKAMTYTKEEVNNIIVKQEEKSTDITVYRGTFKNPAKVKAGSNDTESSPRATLAYSSSTGVGVLRIDFTIVGDVGAGDVIIEFPQASPAPVELLETQTWLGDAFTSVWMGKGERVIRMVETTNNSLKNKRIIVNLLGIFKKGTV